MGVDFDTIVVGAGVIGLAIARELALSGQEVLVLEKADRAGTETSARNSEVIHAGIYYPSDSLKARLCVKGRQKLYAFCAEHGVATRRVGKLIVATNGAEEAKLRSIQTQAFSNGVDDLELLTSAEVAALEPEVRCTAALLSPSTGIMDVQGFMLALHAHAENRGAVFAFRTAFTGAKKSGNQFHVSTIGMRGETGSLTCQTLINCAGHGAHAVAMAIQGYPAAVLPSRFLAKGSYCSVSGKSPFNHLIYPVPVSGALGIHATLEMAGAVRFGPDIQWVDSIDYGMPAALPEKFSAAVRSYWPNIVNRKLSPSYCGIRPKIHGPDKGFADFMIQFEGSHAIAGLVNLFGIESPGLTSSLSIASYVADGLNAPSAKQQFPSED
jgi:L-2-hydroxyglutarate oxidase LhgO